MYYYLSTGIYYNTESEKNVAEKLLAYSPFMSLNIQSHTTGALAGYSVQTYDGCGLLLYDCKADFQAF